METTFTERERQKKDKLGHDDSWADTKTDRFKQRMRKTEDNLNTV